MAHKIPEEDRLLDIHVHEWRDMYGGNGFVKGHPEIFLQSFFCKWCLKIRTKRFNGAQFNVNIPEEELNEPDDGQLA